MTVHAVYRPERMGYDIYVEVGREENGSRLYRASDLDGVTGNVAVQPGLEAPRYMFVEEQIADALVEALAPRKPPASARHLDDAIGVRDRLFSLVERLIP